jgi:hypothetical protein
MSFFCVTDYHEFEEGKESLVAAHRDLYKRIPCRIGDLDYMPVAREPFVGIARSSQTGALTRSLTVAEQDGIRNGLLQGLSGSTSARVSTYALGPIV